MDSHIASQLLFLFFLTMVNAYFAGAEIAVVSVNKNKMKILAADGSRKAQMILDLMEDSTQFLSTIQVAITFAGFFSSASAAVGISQVLANWMNACGIPYSSTASVVIVTLILSYFTLVFGELVPKRIALQKAEQFSLFCVTPIRMISRIMSPFIKLLSLSTNGFLKLIRMKTENLEESVSKEEIRAMVESGSENGVFNEIEKEIIESIFTFDDKDAKDVMIPRSDVMMLSAVDSLKDHLEEILESRYSRIPVYEENIDHIIGIFRVKDFLIDRMKHPGSDSIEITDYLSEPLFVPDRKSIDELFRQMQRERQRMAILIDEYGGFSGIVTLEDLIEEITGDLYEEHETEEPKLVALQKNVYQLDGQMSLDDLNEALHLKLESENYDTISGLIMEHLGTLPAEGSQIELGPLHFKVSKMEGRRIVEVLLKIEEDTQKEPAAQEKD